MADQFFSNFQAAVEGPEDENDAAEAAEAEGGEKKKGWFRRMVG
jgi:hypothetical protein